MRKLFVLCMLIAVAGCAGNGSLRERLSQAQQRAILAEKIAQESQANAAEDIAVQRDWAKGRIERLENLVAAKKADLDDLRATPEKKRVAAVVKGQVAKKVSEQIKDAPIASIPSRAVNPLIATLQNQIADYETLINLSKARVASEKAKMIRAEQALDSLRSEQPTLWAKILVVLSSLLLGGTAATFIIRYFARRF